MGAVGGVLLPHVSVGHPTPPHPSPRDAAPPGAGAHVGSCARRDRPEGVWVERWAGRSPPPPSLARLPHPAPRPPLRLFIVDVDYTGKWWSAGGELYCFCACTHSMYQVYAVAVGRPTHTRWSGRNFFGVLSCVRGGTKGPVFREAHPPEKSNIFFINAKAAFYMSFLFLTIFSLQNFNFNFMFTVG